MMQDGDYPRDGLRDRTDETMGDEPIDKIVGCITASVVSFPTGYVVIVFKPAEDNAAEALFDIASNLGHGTVINVLETALERFKGMN